MQIFSLIRVRWEAILIYFIIFFIVLSIENFLNLYLDFYKLHYESTIVLISLNIVFAFFISNFLEIYFLLAKVLSALCLRLKEVWKYSVPSLLIFSLILLPLLDLTELKNLFFDLKGLKGSIIIAIFGGIFLISVITILFFPTFYGLNGGFVLIAGLSSYFLNKYLIYSYYKDFNIIIFMFFYYLFLYLFYFFLQIRRRIGINIIYEVYIYSKWIVISFLLLSLLFLYFKLNNYNSIEIYFLVLTGLSFSLIDLILSLFLNRESKKNKKIFTIPIVYYFVLSFCIIAIAFYSFFNIKKINKNYLIKYPNISTFYTLEFVHFLLDRDKDGENFFLASDPDDNNIFFRSEGNYDYEKINLQNKSIIEEKFIQNNNSDYIIITFNFKKEHNQNEHSLISPSNDIKINLYSLINNLSSFESFLKQSNKLELEPTSIFTIFTKNYYRTICIGYDSNQNYFSLNSRLRLDTGCEIFLEYKNESNQNDLERLFDFKEFVNINFLKFKSKKNVLWIHYDFNTSTIDNQEIEKFIEQYLAEKNKVIFLSFYEKPVPHFDVFTNIENSNLLMNKKFYNYQVIYRIVYYNEFYSKFKDALFFNHILFKTISNSTKEKNINLYSFIVPEDSYYKELIKIFKEPYLPPISIIGQDNKFYYYDGRFGIEEIIEY